ncbi:MAG TPA: CorA family divalent cation transporter [Patescibacteria group bacterium]|nr:CorA family divalent cation transporter [Patescibacteria group bacterium]
MRVRVFDADRTDRLLELDEALQAKVGSRQLLWIDIGGELTPEQRNALAARFELEADLEGALAVARRGPSLELHGRHFHLRVAAEPDSKHPEDPTWLDLIAGPNLAITRHPAPLRFLEALNERIKADASIGELDSAEFMASVLDGVVTTYHTAIDRIEDELDAHDTMSLTGPRSRGDFIGTLMAIRRRVVRLRRLLAAHREVFATLVRPDFARGIKSNDPEVFLPVSSRFEAALSAADASRELVVSSFDVLMTRTAQRTNDVMRALTLITVLGLPATITAGFLGMNVIVPVSKDDPLSFWLIAGVVLLLEIALVVAARLRHWI